MICLGIESTAHTFSIGLINEKGEILSLISDLYSPSEGGLKPSAVFEHHYHIFQSVFLRALKSANIQSKNVDLIAFSQGPGLGQCLRLGAVFARTLSQILQIPIVGVNHCIAHIEIGRLMCQIADPLSLYVSGGNTIISAFESGYYQIFGETLDISIGNMLDMVARDLGIPHPGGPIIEILARNGKHLIPLPYIVKGMDLSYSGLYSAVRKIIKQKSSLDEEFKADLSYSLQETSFAMLAEVFERAIAHTKKKTALLTGGVAANQRLQTMIKKICAEHGTEFHVVPRQVSGDNGIMIAWTGLLKYKAMKGDSLEKTQIIPKWRMDDVPIPWRHLSFTFDKLLYSEINQKVQKSPSDQDLLQMGHLGGEILHRGAEAALIKSQWQNKDVMVKYRYPKPYRVAEIDQNIWKHRTLLEAKTLIQLSEFGLPVPLVHHVIPERGQIFMTYIPWQSLKSQLPTLSQEEITSTFQNIGQFIAQIHSKDYVHGDLTTSNILWDSPSQMALIDFGLCQRDIKIEDIAMDLHLFKQVLISTHGEVFQLGFQALIQGYQKIVGEKQVKFILNRIEKIELRGRYIAKSERK
jgi:N6-L-threonylcarbamoyladenine synthase/protein kinase Bud32